jgi:hypothetical protein
MFNVPLPSHGGNVTQEAGEERGFPASPLADPAHGETDLLQSGVVE